MLLSAKLVSVDGRSVAGLKQDAVGAKRVLRSAPIRLGDQVGFRLAARVHVLVQDQALDRVRVPDLQVQASADRVGSKTG